MKFIRPVLLCALASFGSVAIADDEVFAPWTIESARSGYWIGAYDNFDSTVKKLIALYQDAK